MKLYDLVVIGADIAGMSAAVSAARLPNISNTTKLAG